MKINLKTSLWILAVFGLVSITSCKQVTGANSDMEETA